MMFDPVDLIDGYRIGTVYPEEVFRWEPGRYIGQWLMTKIFRCRGDDADIIFEAFYVQDGWYGDPYPLPVGF